MNEFQKYLLRKLYEREKNNTLELKAISASNLYPKGPQSAGRTLARFCENGYVMLHPMTVPMKKNMYIITKKGIEYHERNKNGN